MAIASENTLQEIWKTLAALQSQLNGLTEIVRVAQLVRDPADPPEPLMLDKYNGEIGFWDDNYTAALVAEDPRTAAMLADQAVRDRRARLPKDG